MTYTNVYRNFWSEDVLQAISVKITDWSNNKLSMEKAPDQPTEHSDVCASGTILVHDLSGDVELVKILKHELMPVCDTSTLNWIKVQILIYMPGSYMPWHNDGPYCFVSSTYLNYEAWDWNWGGALLVSQQLKENEPQTFYAEFPEYNKMVTYKGKDGNLFHGTSRMSEDSIPRISLQVFAHTQTPDWTHHKV